MVDLEKIITNVGVVITAASFVAKMVIGVIKDFKLVKESKLKQIELIESRIEKYALEAVQFTQQMWKGEEEIKEQMKQDALSYFAQKLAGEKDIKLTDEEINKKIETAVNTMNAIRDAGKLILKKKK